MRRIEHRVYRALLRLLPAELRVPYGDEMEACAAAEIDAGRERGLVRWLGAWAAAAWDVAHRAPREHWRRRHRHQPRERNMHSIVSDLRFAVRSFGRQKGATALVLLTLTLAVAANLAVFTLLDALFLRPFPFAKAERLVYLNEQAPRWNLEFTGINYPDFHVWRQRAHVFEQIALYNETSISLSDGQSAERINGARVTHDFPAVLGIRPVLGRSFTPAEDAPNGPLVVAIGYSLWQTRFAGSRDVIGRVVRINSAPHTIIGVLPPEAEFPGRVQFWLPLRGNANDQSSNYSHDGIARLRPGVTLEQARLDLAEAHRPIWRERDSLQVVSPRIMPLRDRFVADLRVTGKALGAAVVLVLFIACANVAGAILARSIFRQREFGIRLALGASAGRVVRQMMTESLLLAVVAGVLGTVLGWWGVRVLAASIPEQLPGWMQLSADARMIGFSVLIVGFTAVLFGVVPALQVRRQDVRGALAAGGTRTTGSVPQRRMLDALVVLEIALAAVLLAGGGLLLRAYGNLREVDPGFRVDNVATFQVSLPRAKYPTGIAQRQYDEAMVERLRALPGVVGAAAITCPPLTCHWGSFLEAEGVVRAPNSSDPVILLRVATPNYFETMDIRLLHGRAYRPNEGTPRGYLPVVVNESFATLQWPKDEDPTGRRIRFRGDSARWMTVVGVTKDDRHYGLAVPMRPSVFMPMTVMDSSPNFGGFGFVVHTSGDPASMFAAIRGVARDLDPELALYETRTMRTALEGSLAIRRALTVALAIFAGIALTLAIGGIYAVLSYVVGRRRHEIGIRIALGAQTGQVVGHIVRQGLRLVAIGAVLGLPIAYLASKALGDLLVGVTAHDPLTYAAVLVALGVTGAVAALVPARRAAAVAPTEALSSG